jgi:hypothetical protein
MPDIWRKSRVKDRDKYDAKRRNRNPNEPPAVVISQERLDEAQKALDKENERRGFKRGCDKG